MWHWPLKGQRPLFPDLPGRFGAKRTHDIHTGVDLYTEVGTKVVAVEDGEVVKVEAFTGPNAEEPSAWWNDTEAVLVEGASGVIVYGEIASKVQVGDRVRAGDVVGIVETSVLRRFKGRPMVMLHFELMPHGERKTYWWTPDGPTPPVINPEIKLLGAATSVGFPEFFDLETYDEESFRPWDTIPAGVVAVCWQDEILMLHRIPGDRNYEGWCFPGGRMDTDLDGGDTEKAARRELREETGIRATGPLPALGRYKSFQRPRRRVFDMDAYVLTLDTKPSVTLSDEHRDFMWVRVCEAPNLGVVGEATQEILRHLRKPR